VIEVSLRQWLWLLVLASWAAVLVIRPNLYDEERHLLFLFPTLFLAAALGLEFLPGRARHLLAGALVLFSLWSYVQWGPYSYIYKTPLIGKTRAQGFMGEYWGVCLPGAVSALKGRVPPETEVWMIGWFGPMRLQRDRIQNSTLFGDPEWGPYPLQETKPETSPYAAIFINRHGWGMDYGLRDLESGKATFVWSSDLPTGKPACLVVTYRE
jgi:hypothetical protein